MGGGQKNQILDYVIYGLSHRSLSYESKKKKVRPFFEIPKKKNMFIHVHIEIDWLTLMATSGWWAGFFFEFPITKASLIWNKEKWN